MTAVACWITPTGGLAAWCTNCARPGEAGAWHFHGRGDLPKYALTFGARAAHCLHRGFPGIPHVPSYELFSCGFADEELLRAIRKRKPPPNYEQRVLRALDRGLDCFLEELDDMRRKCAPRGTVSFELEL